MKLFNKNELQFVDGMLISKATNDVVCPAPSAVFGLNNLETKYQEAMYLKEQGEYNPAPTLEGFNRETALHSIRVEIPEAETPTLDEQVARSIKITEELDAVCKHDDMVQLINSNEEAFNFVHADYVVDTDCSLYRFDLPYIGNPLELTDEKLVAICEFIIEHGLKIDGGF